MILVTGGTGFVGRYLVRDCLDRGIPIRVLSRRARPAELPGGVEVTPGDLTDPDSVARAVTGVEAIVHLAGRLPRCPPDPELYRINVQGTGNLARAAAEAGVRRFVHVSSGGVYGDGRTARPHREADRPQPGTPYERSKLDGEAAVIEGLGDRSTRWVILRPAGIYGPGREATRRFFDDVRRRRVWLFGPAPVIVHPTHVRDVVQAILCVLDRPDAGGRVFNVGGERALDYGELIVTVGAALGRRPRILRPPAATGALLPLAAAVGTVMHRPVPASMRPGGVHRALDTSSGRTELGLTPVPLREGLAEVAAWLRQPAA